MGARPQFVENLINELFSWAKQDDTPALIKSSVMHYEIEMIHPLVMETAEWVDYGKMSF